MIVGGFDSAGITEAVQNAENIYEKIVNPFKEQLFILDKLLAFFFFFKIYHLKKKLVLTFFPFSNLTQISTAKFWTHVGRKFVTSVWP